MISYGQFPLTELRTEHRQALKEKPITDLRCRFMTGIFHISLGLGFGLFETSLKVFDKGILFFDLLSPN